MNPFHGGWAILLSLLVAMLFAIFHLPEDWPNWIGWFRPNWIVLVLFFWVVEIPNRIGLVSVWIMGLFVDALLAEPLGINGVIFASVTYIVWRFFERLRMYSALQQCGVLFVMVLAGELLRATAIGFESERQLQWQVVLTAVSSMILWPFVYLLLIRVKTAVRVD